MPADEFAAAVVDVIVEDRRPTLPSDRMPSERTYMAVAGELRATIYQVAEMAEHEPHQLIVAADYLHGLLDREPLRSGAAWEPQRVVLGLFLMGLSNALAQIEVITTAERDALRPAFYRAAVEAVAAEFDITFTPPEDEEPMTTETALETTDDDAARYL